MHNISKVQSLLGRRFRHSRARFKLEFPIAIFTGGSAIADLSETITILCARATRWCVGNLRSGPGDDSKRETEKRAWGPATPPSNIKCRINACHARCLPNQSLSFASSYVFRNVLPFHYLSLFHSLRFRDSLTLSFSFWECNLSLYQRSLNGPEIASRLGRNGSSLCAKESSVSLYFIAFII